ncbi:MAG: hypothetical protein A2X61_03205 [Ignavibacteria bacterium GWB2_35_12]|nr:MAG: hypothetical protein A2X63_05425 [Ignavibacteria bacterium GWA2_35_8]OGU38292.1 MAG: hypothetical protein A2X61_03205 [Ignavibacteria bacterium GWB2_35_12]OGU95248.1 MAG: hypothetical protein A2220_02140 [Ignavibacteria bacterium RIFOXYA2_FULL_35_10]OGV20770.1 MAG: hypothetical protein A2475_11340 [Ignavibacteria bacterium RIFOXYC2_FULL_35_21]
MIISQDTKEVVKFLQDSSGGNLRKPNDLEIFLEIGATFGQENLINDFIFNGASIWYLFEALKKTKQGEEGFNKLDVELKDNLIKFQSQINTFISFSDDGTNQRIKNVYLQNTQGAYLNLLDLAHDLSELKYVQNKMKSKK